MSAVLDTPLFQDAELARKALENIRWPNGPTCPHCGSCEKIAAVEGTKKSHRPGLYYCNACKGQFTVTVGTIFEDSKVPLNKWWMAVFLLCSSKKGISSHQLHRMLGVSYKTAWFMTHRIREAMRDGSLAPFGGAGGIVEVDETFIGVDRTKKPHGEKKGRGFHHKHKVLSLVDRTSGQKRSMVVDDLSARTLVPILKENIAAEARVMTDEASQYRKLGAEFASHGFVRHGADEYVNPEDRTIHTNTIEGAFSVFKRGIKGVYQHCGKQHLHRYVAEFDFRYNTRAKLGVSDTERAYRTMAGIECKRLTYRRPNKVSLCWECAN